MAMHHHTGVVEYVAIWMVMMVPMMLPALVPMLLRYRRSVQGVSGTRLHGLTVVVGAGYYAVWAVIGVAVWVVGAGIMAAEMRWGWVGEWKPVATGVVLLVAGGLQLTEWKARQLADCGEGSGCESMTVPRAQSAWRHGLSLGGQCSLCCGNLMLALLVLGPPNAVAMVAMTAMAAVTLAIAAERLWSAPLLVARVSGVVIVVVGVLTIARM